MLKNQGGIKYPPSEIFVIRTHPSYHTAGPDALNLPPVPVWSLQVFEHIVVSEHRRHDSPFNGTFSLALKYTSDVIID